MTAQPSQFPSLISPGSGILAGLSVELVTSPVDRRRALEKIAPSLPVKKVSPLRGWNVVCLPTHPYGFASGVG
jgi:hypothetical protein